MVCLGFKPGVAGWNAHMKPWSYGGRPENWDCFIENAISQMFYFVSFAKLPT